MGTEQRIIDYLNGNREQNIPALIALKAGARAVVCEQGGVVLYDPVNRLYFVSADDNAVLQGGWWDKSLNAEVLALRERNIDAAAQHIGARHVRRCHQVVFTRAPQCRTVEGLAIEPLDERHIDFVCGHYAMALERDYLLERLSSGSVFGAYYQGDPAGFIGRHSEGSIGMLEVLPQYKRRGIGTALACFMIRRVLSLGETPYAHIFVGNEASLQMIRRIPGAVLLDECVAWVD